MMPRLLYLAIALHIFSVGLGVQNQHQPLARREPSFGHENRPLRVEVDGNAEVVVNDHGAASSWRAEPSAESQSTPSSDKTSATTQPPRRRGVLKPPMPLERKKMDAGSEKSSVRRHHWRNKRNARTNKPKLTRKQSSKHHAQAADTWRFRGPKPFALLSDPRYTDAEKETELERLMEKLHLEFFKKHQMGHSRIAQARAMFYEVVADYQHLTGKDHPPDFRFEELPVVSGSVAELDDDQDDVGVTDLDDQVMVPNEMPKCLQPCQNAGAVCYTDASKWTSTEACTCYQSWLTCSLNLCSATERDQQGFFIALETAEAEACAWPHDRNLYNNLHIDELKKALVYEEDNGDGPNTPFYGSGTSFLDEGDPSPLGFHIVSLLETPTGGLTEMEANASYGGNGDDGKTRHPPGCMCSNPEMLGDGNCDGGGYNTKECNYDGGDCCDVDCRPAKHRCGSSGYQCNGARVPATVHENFKCDANKLKAFEDYVDFLRDELTLGNAMKSECPEITTEEHEQLAQAFNLGIELQTVEGIASAAAAKGGPLLAIDCKLWDEQMGNDWFGTLITHEYAHVAGYGHPDFKQKGIVYPSECENLGSELCAGHCKEWTKACQNHLVFGSEGCGFAKTGCQTTCVHKDYCHSLPERTTECFGYQKVHSRGESLSESFNQMAGKGVDKVKGWFGWESAAPGPSVALPLTLAVVAMVSLIGGAC